MFITWQPLLLKSKALLTRYKIIHEWLGTGPHEASTEIKSKHLETFLAVSVTPRTHLVEQGGDQCVCYQMHVVLLHTNQVVGPHGGL